jgi:DNA-binding response OmpR family regulator
MVSGKVLIADDEPNIVTSLEFIMRRSGFTTAVARDGQQALDEVERFRPDLLLLDAMMPRRDGFEVCQLLRAGGWHELKIIMLTAKGREAEVAKGLAVGADAYVIKPFSTRDLVAQVSRLLAGGSGDAPGH